MVKTFATCNLIRLYRDTERFESLCRSCPNYGRRWGCPPMAGSPYPDIACYPSIDIHLLKIDVPVSSSGGSEILTGIIDRHRRDYEPLLLAAEKELDGFAVLFTGQCRHCGDTPCARTAGKPCRHPDIVRPSLEALGFDLTRIASDLFDTPIQWAAEGKLPPYLTLVGGVFH